ncbi:hypothetical protein ACFYTF_24290 [Nocardia thailandica]|uniref:Polyketide cyclase n=1 Tax=Nocardia thailandica TaxID=257275 RepID=A0ABW6PUE0_9NOCA
MTRLLQTRSRAMLPAPSARVYSSLTDPGTWLLHPLCTAVGAAAVAGELCRTRMLVAGHPVELNWRGYSDRPPDRWAVTARTALPAELGALGMTTTVMFTLDDTPEGCAVSRSVLVALATTGAVPRTLLDAVTDPAPNDEFLAGLAACVARQAHARG